MVDPPVKFKTIKGHALAADADFGEVRANFRVEPVAVHAEIAWGIAETEQSRSEVLKAICLPFHDWIGISGQDRPYV